MGGRERKKAETPCEEGAPMWMVTYSDMVTLLLTFFAMMMAMANFEDIGRTQAVMESIRQALGVGGFDSNLMGIDSAEAFQVAEITQPDQVMPIVSELREALARHLSDNLVRMSNNRTEVRVMLSDRVLFAPGSASIHPAAYSLLGDVAEVLSHYPVDVVAEGHSDATGELEKNWELSAQRAVAVISVLQDRGGLDGRRLEVIGYGQFRPAEITAGGPSYWDRRVELVIHSDHRSAYEAVHGLDAVQGGSHGR